MHELSGHKYWLAQLGAKRRGEAHMWCTPIDLEYWNTDVHDLL